MKRTQIILYGAIGFIILIILVCTVIIVSPNNNDYGKEDENSSSVEVSIKVPNDSKDQNDSDILEDIPPSDHVDDNDKIIIDDSAKDDPNHNKPVVEGVINEDISDKKPQDSKTENNDTVVSGVKDKEIQQIGPASGEDRNDIIIKEKEAESPKKAEPSSATVKDEKSGAGNEKESITTKDDDSSTDVKNKNEPIYAPSKGGDNPFNSDTKTEIVDTPVENYIGDGEDRPGGGIKF